MIKKFLIFIGISLFSTITFAGVKATITEDKKNEVRISEQEKIAEATKAYNTSKKKSYLHKICLYKVRLALLDAELNSFDDYKNIVDKVYTENNFKEGINYFNFCGELLWWFRDGKILKEEYQYAKSENAYRVMRKLLMYYPKLDITNQEKFKDLETCLLRGEFNSNKHDTNAASKLFDSYMKLAPDFDENEVKSSLKKMNRIFSQKLIEDKASWEPLVAKIRTALETY